MTEQNNKKTMAQNISAEQSQASEKHRGEELGAAGKSLSEALRVSFIILKIIMIVLVGLFMLSGFETIGFDEQALILRFGKIRGVGEDRILSPRARPYWVFPYPVEEIIKIPVAKTVDLAINSFWYYESLREKLPPGPKNRPRIKESLGPLIDGYCITRSEKQSRTASGSEGSDYNIVHCRWQLTYQIDNPELFFKNVYIEDIKPGQIYFDVITKNVTPLLENLIEGAVTTATVNYTVDEVMFEQVAKVTDHVKRLLQENLDAIESGIKVVTVQLTDKSWPRQVDDAFLNSLRASQESQRAISEARTYAENTLIEAAGRAEEIIAEARAYRTNIVTTAKANADYLQEILPEYRKNPELFLQSIYLDAIKYVFDNAEEKFIIQHAKGAEGAKIIVLVSRDRKIKPKSEKTQ